MLVNFVIVLSLLLGFCGLAIDVGMLELKKVQLQNAADAAVLGAVYEHGRGTTNWKDGGKADAGLNGFTDKVNNVTVAINNPPASGSFSNNQNAVQAVVTQQVGTSFTGSSYTLAAQAVSLLPPAPCLTYLLSTTANNTLNVAGSYFTSACSVYIGLNIFEDSSSVIQAANFNVVGSSSSLHGWTTPGPTYNYPIQNDPLAATVQPVFSRCRFNGPDNNNTTRTLDPGTYCNNSIQCTGKNTLTLNSGLYIITGGVSWNDCTIKGGTAGGVTLFLTQGGGSSFGLFNAVLSNVSLSAPTDSSNGKIPGILLFMDRNWPDGHPRDVIWNNSVFNGDGIFYSVKTGMNVSGSYMSGSNYLGFVIDNLLLVSGSVITAPYANASAGGLAE